MNKTADYVLLLIVFLIFSLFGTWIGSHIHTSKSNKIVDTCKLQNVTIDGGGLDINMKQQSPIVVFLDALASSTELERTQNLVKCYQQEINNQ